MLVNEGKSVETNPYGIAYTSLSTAPDWVWTASLPSSGFKTKIHQSNKLRSSELYQQQRAFLAYPMFTLCFMSQFAWNSSEEELLLIDATLEIIYTSECSKIKCNSEAVLAYTGLLLERIISVVCSRSPPLSFPLPFFTDESPAYLSQAPPTLLPLSSCASQTCFHLPPFTPTCK